MNRGWVASRWLLIAMCVAAPVVRYLSHDLPVFFIANADMLAVPALAEQVTRDGFGALTAWYWPPAPYLLYDVVVYGAIWFALPDVWLAPAVFMVVQLVLLYGAIRWFAGALVPSEHASWGAVASFGVVLAFASHLAEPARFVLVSYYRAGTFILSLVVLAVALRWIGCGRVDGRWRIVAASFVLSATAVVSDPLVLPSTLGPLFLLAAVLAFVPTRLGGLAAQRTATVRHLGALLVAVPVGLVVNGWIATDASTYGPAVQGSQIRAQASLLVEVFALATWAMRIGTFLAVVVGAGAILVERRRHGAWRVTPLVAAVVFWVVSSASHLTAMVLDTQAPALRYLQLVVLLPLVWAGPILVEAAHRMRLPAVPSVLGVATLVVAPALVVVQPAIGEVDDIDWSYRMPEVECLDAVVPGDSNGVSGYWEARVIMLHSAYEREVAPLTDGAEPMRINASPSWFDRPTYDFALVWTKRPGWDPPIGFFEALDPSSISTDCGSHVVLDASTEGFDLNSLADDGASVRYDGCELGTLVGEIEASDCAISVPAGVEGFANFGGYTPLSPGTFVVTLEYATSPGAGTPEAMQQPVAVMEVTRLRSRISEVEIVASETMAGPEGGGRTSVSATITVPDDGDAFIAEVRSRTDGAAPFTILGATIERLD